MKIGWIVPTIGIFGAVREMIEVSNVLVEKGHEVFIYHPEGTACKWLTCLAKCRRLDYLPKESLDVLIGIVDWKTELYTDLVNADAKVKAICLLGFNPTDEMAAALRGEKEPADKAEKIIFDAISKNYLLLADSSWQIGWIREKVGYDAGPSFGGINLEMFNAENKPENRIKKIIFSNDPRERKGTDTVLKAIEIIQKSKLKVEFDSYWNRGYSQKQLVEFYKSADIFLDGHRRAGWCNPVAEAIACGTVPVCTRIGANSDFAVNEVTAFVVPIDDAESMADRAIFLAENEVIRHKMAENGLQHIKNFSYENIVPHLEKVLEIRLNENTR